MSIDIVTVVQAQDAVRSYLSELSSAGRRASTLRGYETDLRVLIECAAKYGGVLDERVVSEYLAWPTARAAATRARRLSALRGLLRSCDRTDLLPRGGDVGRPHADAARRPVRPDLPSAIDAVFAVIPRHADRDQLLFGLLAHLGLRPGEALALQVEDFEEQSASLAVTGWAGRRRRVFVDNREVLLRLTNYVRFAALPSGPLFAAPGRETPVRYQSVQHRWAQYCSLAGVDLQLSDLRRAHVADLIAGGVPELIIRERIGQAAGALYGTSAAFSSEESDEAMRAWQERRGAPTTGDDAPNASERRAG